MQTELLPSPQLIVAVKSLAGSPAGAENVATVPLKFTFFVNLIADPFNEVTGIRMLNGALVTVDAYCALPANVARNM